MELKREIYRLKRLNFSQLENSRLTCDFSQFDGTVACFPPQALSLVVLQMLELIVVLLLLRCTGNPQYKLRDFFQEKQSTRERNWLLASALGFVFLVVLVFITSIIADTLVGTKVSCFQFLFQLHYQFDCWNV